MNRNPIIGGSLTFMTPYNGRAMFDWWLDAHGHDVIVECMNPYKGLTTDVHQMNMAPRFSHAKARQLAERLCHIIIENLEIVIEHRNDAHLELASYYDNRQLPLYKKWAREERKRRLVEVKPSPLKIIREAGPFKYEELKKKWRLA